MGFDQINYSSYENGMCAKVGECISWPFQKIQEGVDKIDQFIYEKTRFSIKRTAAEVGAVALHILKGCAALCLFLVSPGMFFVGLVIGILSPKTMNDVVKRIMATWNSLNLGLKALAITACVILAPVTIPITAIVAAGHLGTRIFRN